MFWMKYRNRLNEFTNGMSTELYSIAPNSFNISWNNYRKVWISTQMGLLYWQEVDGDSPKEIKEEIARLEKKIEVCNILFDRAVMEEPITDALAKKLNRLSNGESA